MTTPTPTHATPPWRGIHHIALLTRDLDATIDFYQTVLGMHVGEIFPASRGRGRHCFIKPGDSETWGLHFFEQPDAQVFAYPDITQRLAFVPGALQHIAFALPDEVAAVALRTRLRAHHVEMTPIMNLGSVHNMLFKDNNGVLLEAAWSKE